MATIEKRGGSFRIRVSCSFDQSGKHIFQTTTWKPDPGMTKLQIEKELNKAAVEFELKIENGYFISEENIRFVDFCPMYLDNVKGRLSPLTLISYRTIINTYLIPMLGRMKLKDIHPQHVQNFVRDLVNSNKRFDGKEGKIANATIKRIYTVLQAILHNACKMDLISTNPANKEKIELPSAIAPDVEIFTQEEAAEMLECLSKEPLMYQVLINLAIVTGCRRGELVALEWSDIDFSKATISISKSNYSIKGEGIHTKKPKTAGSRRILAIPPTCVKMLQTYRYEQALERLKLGDQWEGKNWIFIQWNGLPMYPSTPTLWFSKFLKHNGFRHRKFHSLRHTSATLLLTNGTNIKTVSTRLGHKKLSTTNIYLHSVTSADIAAANTFEVLLESNHRRA